MATRYSKEQLIAMVRGASARYGIDADIGVRQLAQESINFTPDVVYGPRKSPAGAMGIAQFMPDTAKRFGLSNPFDPVAALEAWGKYMRELLSMFNGRYDLALAGYNWGENRNTLRTALRDGKGVLAYSIPAETRGYVTKILSSSQLPPNVAVVPSVVGVPLGAPPSPAALASGAAGLLPAGGSAASWGPLGAIVMLTAIVLLLD